MSSIYRPDEFANRRGCDSRQSTSTSLSNNNNSNNNKQQPDIILTTALCNNNSNNNLSSNNNDYWHTYPPPNKSRDTSRMTTSLFEDVILSSNEPIEINETDEITIDGYSGILANKAEINEWKGTVPLKEYEINRDPNPEIINKKTAQEIDYVQELAFRYLRPPTPPPPGEIIIRKLPATVTPPAPPIIIRQQPARPITPQPLVIREAPPPIPAPIGRKVINISGKRIPPPPRKVIIERLAPLPTKPQSVLIERWLPYPQLKRKVIFKPCEQKDPVVVKPKNIIIQWEAPKVNITKVVKNLGVIRANPHEYLNRFGRTLHESQELPQYIKQLESTSLGIELASNQSGSMPPELCGDIFALNLIDLEKEGLGEYKKFLEEYNYQQKQQQQQNQPFSPPSSSSNHHRRRRHSSSTTNRHVAAFDRNGSPTVLERIFNEVSVSYDGKISLEEAKRVFQKLSLLLGKEFDETTITNLFKSIGVYTSYFIDFEDFKRSLKNML